MPAIDFNKVYHSSPVPSFVGQDGFIRLVNRRMVQLAGYTEEEFLQIPVAELIYPEDRYIINNALHQLSEEKIPGKYEFRLINRQKEVLHVNAYFSAIEYDGSWAFFCQLFDVIQKKYIQGEHHNAYFRQLFEDSPNKCRTLSIADDYNAMAVDRPHHKVLSHSKAISKLKRCSGIQFDPYFASISFNRFVTCGNKLEMLALEQRDTLRETQRQRQLQIEITGRQQLESNINHFLKLSGEIFLVVNLEGHIKFTNDAFGNITGYAKEEVLSKTVSDYIHPDDINRNVKEKLILLSSDCPPVNYAERFRCKDGSYRWLEWNAVQVLAEGLVYAVARDITSRKTMEKELKLNEARLKTLVNLSQMTEVKVEEIYDFIQKEGVMLTESDFGFLGFINENETTLTTWSWSTDVLNKCNMLDKPLVSPVETSGLWGEVIRTRRPIIINDYAAPNPLKKGCPNDHIPLSRVIVVPVFADGKVVMIAAMANKKEDYNETDMNQLTLLMNQAWKIIRRRQIIKELRSSEDRFHKAFHTSPSIMTIISFQSNRFIDVNESFVRIFGCSREEVIGRTALELQLIKASDRHNMMKEFKLRGALHNYEYVAKTKSGEKRILLVSAEVITLNNEKCLLFASHDITEYKQLEREMARLDRLNLVGEMAAGIAHEIRNPMTTVRGFLQLLSTRKESCQHKEYFDLMIDELDRANAIITEFLSLSKGKSVQNEKGNINDFIMSLFPLFNADALENDVNVELQLSDVPDLYIDKNEVRQLVLNLFRNGLEAMSKGKTLTIKTFVDGQGVVLAVQDEGPGIPLDILGKIGTPFLSTKENGAGLGLTVCYSIAARQKANIEVKTSSAGTTFFVRFKID